MPETKQQTLTPVALRQSLIILKSLFAFLMSQGYVVGNPFAAVALPSNPQHPLGSSRSLTRVGGKRSTPLSRNAPA